MVQAISYDRPKLDSAGNTLKDAAGKVLTENVKTRTEVTAKRLKRPEFDSDYTLMDAGQLRKDDYILVAPKESIAGDGDVVVGAALVNEAAVTGESAPVVREAGGDRSAVTGGTEVIASTIIVRITANPGETFLDRMITLIEGAKRRKTPNEIALEVLLIALTLVFLLAVANMSSLSAYSVKAAGHGTPVTLTILVALFVCLAPTTIAALLPAIGIAGMDRLFQKNVIALSGGHRGGGGCQCPPAGQDRRHHPGQPGGGGFCPRGREYREGSR